MKKLMIAAAIVCAAAVSQAAQMNWGGDVTATEQAGQDEAGYVNPGAIYQLWALDTAVTDTSLFSYDGSVLTAEGVKASLVDSHTVLENPDWDNGNFTASLPEAPAADLNGYYAVVLIDTTVNDKIYSVETFQMSALSDDGGAKKLNFTTGADATMLSGSAVGQNWQDVAAVPEPTSGLLLLLGVAGLALRRRRA